MAFDGDLSTKSLQIPALKSIAEDKERVDALYSPFREESLNPHSYQSKLAFWMNAIKDYCSVNKRIRFSVEEIRCSCQLFGKSPICIDTVVADMESKGIIVRHKHYSSYLSENDGAASWTTTLKKVVGYIANSSPKRLANIFPYFADPINGEEPLIHLGVLHDHLDTLRAKGQQFNGKIIEKSEWQAGVYEMIGISSEDLQIFEGFLTMKKVILIDTHEDIDIVKMSFDKSDDLRLNLSEKRKFQIQVCRKQLERNITALNSEWTNLKNKIKHLIEQKDLPKAKLLLRRHGIFKKRIEKLTSALENIVLMEAQIADAETDAKVLKAYEEASRVLKQVMEENDLNEANVAGVLSDVESALLQSSRVNDMVGSEIQNEDGITKELSEELDRELQIILAEESQRDQITQLVKHVEELSVEDSELDIKSKIVSDPATQSKEACLDS